jgi:hypothetical protein
MKNGGSEGKEFDKITNDAAGGLENDRQRGGFYKLQWWILVNERIYRVTYFPQSWIVERNHY